MLKPLTLFATLATLDQIAQASTEIIPDPATVQALTAWSIGAVLGVVFLALEGYARKLGGLTFIRLGRLQFSFCITKG